MGDTKSHPVISIAHAKRRTRLSRIGSNSLSQEVVPTISQITVPLVRSYSFLTRLAHMTSFSWRRFALTYQSSNLRVWTSRLCRPWRQHACVVNVPVKV